MHTRILPDRGAERLALEAAVLLEAGAPAVTGATGDAAVDRSRAPVAALQVAAWSTHPEAPIGAAVEAEACLAVWLVDAGHAQRGSDRPCDTITGWAGGVDPSTVLTVMRAFAGDAPAGDAPAGDDNGEEAA